MPLEDGEGEGLEASDEVEEGASASFVSELGNELAARGELILMGSVCDAGMLVETFKLF